MSSYLILGIIIFLIIFLIFLYYQFIYLGENKMSSGGESGDVSEKLTTKPLPLIDNIEIKNIKNSVQLVEVEVFNDKNENITSKGIPTQTSILDNSGLYTPERAVDGSFDVIETPTGVDGISATSLNVSNGTWELTFAEPFNVSKINIWYRNDKKTIELMPSVLVSLYKGRVLVSDRHLKIGGSTTSRAGLGVLSVNYITSSEEENEEHIAGEGLMSLGSVISDIQYPIKFEGGSYYNPLYPYINAPQILEGEQALIMTNQPRYIRLEKIDSGNGSVISVSEIEAYDNTLLNVALGKKVRLSSQISGTSTGIVVDGKHPEMQIGVETINTSGLEGMGWVEVDLGDEFILSKIVIYNTEDDKMKLNMIGVKLVLLDNSRQIYEEFNPIEKIALKYEFIVASH